MIDMQTDIQTAFYVRRQQIIPIRELSNKVFWIKQRHLPSVQSCKVLSCKDAFNTVNQRTPIPSASGVRGNINDWQSDWQYFR